MLYTVLYTSTGYRTRRRPNDTNETSIQINGAGISLATNQQQHHHHHHSSSSFIIIIIIHHHHSSSSSPAEFNIAFFVLFP
jgi:hypothetical protein